MPDSDRSMLTSLLGLKVRREQKIRTTITQLNQQEIELESRKAQLTLEQRLLREAWQACNESRGVLKQTELIDLKEELANYFQRDQLFIEQLSSVKMEQQKVQEDRAEQQQLLRKVLLEQEKLTYLLEEMKYEASKSRR